MGNEIEQRRYKTAKKINFARLNSHKYKLVFPEVAAGACEAPAR